jgi:methylmalonyl-CoA mutase cobalamin-binding domain/chain
LTDETMTSHERIQAALSLEPVDRHPVFPILVTAGPRLYGITQGEAWRNHDAAREALLWCFKEFGYDCGLKPNYYYPMLPGRHCGAPVRNLIPGRQLGEDDLYQIDEKVLFPREDYDRIAALGWNAYWDEHYEQMSGKTTEKLTTMQTLSNLSYNEDMKICEEQGMPVFLGVAVDSVMMAFSMCRTLNEFTRDLYEVPDKVEAAMRASCYDLVSNAVQVCKNNGKMMAFVVLERGSGAYYRLDIFERFEWPWLKVYVDAFISEGITPWLHFDTDWSLNLPYLKKLPKGKCVCDLDGMTDIFQAKEILKGHMCVSGDVPAALLSLGRPDEVETYCKKLIDEVGEGGGFMLTTGCECPVDVKPENLRAMVETGKTYRGKKTARPSVRPAEVTPAKPKRDIALKGDIGEALFELRFDEMMEMVDRAIAEKRDPLEIFDECRSGMDKVGELYSTGEYFLAELILSADVFKDVAAKLEPLILAGNGKTSKDAVVIATPKGDVHDIGKNITATLFKASGFIVHDLGVDVAPEVIVDKVAETGARVVAMSALITPTFNSMKQVVDLLKDRGLRNDRYVIIGGGPTTEGVRDFVGADAWTLNPKKGVNLCEDYLSATTSG